MMSCDKLMIIKIRNGENHLMMEQYKQDGGIMLILDYGMYPS